MEENNKNESNRIGHESKQNGSINAASFGTGVQGQYGHFEFMSQKSQRLATAIYMLTGLFESGDPLRATLRERALSLISNTMSLSGAAQTERDENMRAVFLICSEILSYCEIGFASQMISEMNHTVLKREFHAFMDVLTSKKFHKEEEQSFAIPSNFFDVSDMPAAKHPTLIERNPFERAATGTFKSAASSGRDALRGYKGQSVKDSSVLEKGTVKEASSNRKDIILKTFKQSNKASLSIKDISEFVKDCSEKTIQRQLIELVKTGVLDKQGERRWSTYSLKK